MSVPLAVQEQWLKRLIASAKNTSFGKDHGFSSIKNYEDWKNQVPLRDYEAGRKYFDQTAKGVKDVLWPGRPVYLAKTSGTTSGAKYIPITKESMPEHIKSAKMALLSYMKETGDASFVDGKMMFLQGSPVLEDKDGLKVGRLSGIVAHHVPGYLQRNRVPGFETNSIEDWETKVDTIVKETANIDLRLLSGIPSWVQMYAERLLEYTGKANLKEVFPHLSLFVYGGVNYDPYRAVFASLFGASIPSVELYPASEGFFAYQDSQSEEGLLLELDSGIFYEFVPLEEYGQADAKRLWLGEVELGRNYALIVNSNAGLWGYDIGDTVKFVSLDPYRIVVSGRVKHFTSAFGEHVIAEEVESAMTNVCESTGASVIEFHLAPQTAPAEGLPFHEWFIEFAQHPADMAAFEAQLDEAMVGLNPYYKDLISGAVLRPLVVSEIKGDGFREMMRSRGKLGGQNKIPRLANDRKVAEVLEDYRS